MIAIRWLVKGRTYGAMIGPIHPIRTGIGYTPINYRQFLILDAFKLTSLRVDMDVVAQWLVWDTDLIELHATKRAVWRWVMTGSTYV